MSELVVTTVSDVTSFERLGPEWNALLARTSNELPFLLHRWMLAWWNAFHQDNVRLKDALFIQTVRTREGKLVGIIPLMKNLRPGRGPIGVRTLTFLGADPYITELRRAIVDPEHEEAVARAVMRRLSELGGWDWIHWTGLVRGTPFTKVLEEETTLEWSNDLSAHELTLAATWDDLRKNLKRNIKESLRHCYNAPKRDGHEIRLEVASTRADVTIGVARFLEMHSMRADATDTIEHPNRFAWVTAQRFLLDVCQKLADDDVTRVFTLFVKDTPVACRIGFMLPDTLYLYYSGYDPTWRKYSVMTTTVAEAIKYAIEHKKKTVHLSTGTDVSKTRWGAMETMFHDALVVRSSKRSQLVRRGWVFAERAREDARFASLLRWIPQRTLE